MVSCNTSESATVTARFGQGRNGLTHGSCEACKNPSCTETARTSRTPDAGCAASGAREMRRSTEGRSMEEIMSHVHEADDVALESSFASADRRTLTDVEVAARLGVSRFTVRSWRLKGLGPRFLKMGRAVRCPTGRGRIRTAGSRRDAAPIRSRARVIRLRFRRHWHACPT